MPNHEPDPLLVKKAVDDREAHPWRYYRLEHEAMKRIADQQAAEIQRLSAALKELQEELESARRVAHQCDLDMLTAQAATEAAEAALLKLRQGIRNLPREAVGVMQSEWGMWHQEAVMADHLDALLSPSAPPQEQP